MKVRRADFPFQMEPTCSSRSGVLSSLRSVRGRAVKWATEESSALPFGRPHESGCVNRQPPLKTSADDPRMNAGARQFTTSLFVPPVDLPSGAHGNICLINFALLPEIEINFRIVAILPLQG